MIKILHCMETIGSGGVEQRRLSLAKFLNKDLYLQSIVCTKAIGKIPAELEKAGCKVHEVGLPSHPFDIEFHRKVLSIIKEFKPDIIHGAVFEGITMASICGTLAKVPIIIGEETSDPKNRSWKANLLLKGLSLLTHRMIGVSPASYNYLVNNINISKDKTVLINNGIEFTKPTSLCDQDNLRKALKIESVFFTIGFVGRLFDNHKRISDLIKAFSVIVKESPKTRLLIVGEGPDKEMLRDLCNELEVLASVIFVGYQSETRIYYDIMDIFVLPSAFEAFGLVLVEAMAAGLPIIASRVGGIPYVVDEGNTGLLFEAKNINELVDKISYIKMNPLIGKEMGKMGRERAIENFSAERYVRDVHMLYQDLLINYECSS